MVCCPTTKKNLQDKFIRQLNTTIEQAQEKIAAIQEEMGSDLLDDLTEEEHAQLDQLTSEVTDLKSSLVELTRSRTQVTPLFFFFFGLVIYVCSLFN